MAVDLAMEDDLFFADLNRQISLLIEEDDNVNCFSNFPSVSPQGYPGSNFHPPMMQSQYNMYQENCRREMSKGTGVFIPQSSQPRRKYKQGKRSAASTHAAKSKNKQLINSRGRSNVPAQQTFTPAYSNDINGY